MNISKKADYKEWLGQMVTVIVDRPIGSMHPEYNDLKYSVNYGHIPGIYSDIDQEEIDAYILGQPQPLKKFVGQVIAVVVRNDDEIKLIVTDGTEMGIDEIETQLDFQEKYFKHSIIPMIDARR